VPVGAALRDSVGVVWLASAGRVLPIPDALLSELSAARARQAAERLALGEAYAGLGYVVCNEAGEPSHPSTLSTMWQTAIKNLTICDNFGCDRTFVQSREMKKTSSDGLFMVGLTGFEPAPT
jgi:hypothetical protein